MRAAQYKTEEIIGATAAVVARGGPAAASIAKIARTIGAPTGSIYYRFASRDVLLGEVWLQAAETFQDGFLRKVEGHTGPSLDDDIVLHVPNWVRQHPTEAKILLLHRREEFRDEKWPQDLRERAKQLAVQLSRGHRDLTERFCGRVDSEATGIVLFAVANAPIAAVKPFIQKGTHPPPFVDDIVRATFHACMALLRNKP